MLSHQPGCWKQAFMVATLCVATAIAAAGVVAIAIGAIRNVLA